jgi:hypothetical protein
MDINLCNSRRQDEDIEWFHFIYIFCLIFTTKYIHCICRFRILHLSPFIPLVKICNGRSIEICEYFVSGSQFNVSVAVIYSSLVPPPLIKSRMS